MTLWRITLAGDAFLVDPSDGSIHFLDTIGGKLERVADDKAGFEAAIKTFENFDRWCMPTVVDGQGALGMKPAKGQCLSFKHPPALGGQLEPDNFEVCDVAVHFSIAGQLHRQIKDLPPGTKVSSIELDGVPGTKRRPWWRFW